MEIIDPLAEEYATLHSSDQSFLLRQIEEDTLKRPEGHMVSGKLQGRFLSFISKLLSPSYILEIGTYTGFSALCLLEGLKEGGELHTIELREADGETARKNFMFSEKNKLIYSHIGDAMLILPSLKTLPWDLVFLDANKTGYIAYYEMVLPTMRAGGVLIADNVFFHGDAIQPSPKGKNGKAIDLFNKHVANDGRVEKVMLPLRDGLYLIRKK